MDRIFYKIFGISKIQDLLDTFKRNETIIHLIFWANFLLRITKNFFSFFSTFGQVGIVSFLPFLSVL